MRTVPPMPPTIGALRAVAEFAAAFAPSKERHLETTAQGRAFLDTTRAAWPCAGARPADGGVAGPEVTLPVAAGVACAGHGIPLAPALPAYLHAMAANAYFGRRAAHSARPDRRPARAGRARAGGSGNCAERALATPLDDIGGAAFRADIASMRHETQYTRLFRS